MVSGLRYIFPLKAQEMPLAGVLFRNFQIEAGVHRYACHSLVVSWPVTIADCLALGMIDPHLASESATAWTLSDTTSGGLSDTGTMGFGYRERW